MAKVSRPRKPSAQTAGPASAAPPMPAPDVSAMGYNPANFACTIGTGPWVRGYAVSYAVSFWDARTQRESARSAWWGPKSDPKKLYGGYGLTEIPTDPTGQATARRIWRRFAGQAESMIHQIPDNTTTRYQDDVLWVPAAAQTTALDIGPLRVRHREEMNCQIVHDSIPRREGWTLTYGLSLGDALAGYGCVAVAGPWQGRPTLFEFCVLPDARHRAFELFEALLATSGARFMEIQSNDALATIMLHAYARRIRSEKILFRDGLTTALPASGARLRCVTPEEETRRCIEQRQGGAQWELDLRGVAAAKGGLMFHYNRPYADIYMEVAEPFRQRGLGSYLVQELKRAAYALGSIPCARCNPDNQASRRTLRKAGLVPCGHVLTGSVR